MKRALMIAILLFVGLASTSFSTVADIEEGYRATASQDKKQGK